MGGFFFFLATVVPPLRTMGWGGVLCPEPGGTGWGCVAPSGLEHEYHVLSDGKKRSGDDLPFVIGAVG